ncbi:MAG: AAA family ATPase [Eubacteriaceae bacterium]|nr:AAA family ATPase [Eubacteriaceae bacterium]
MDKTRYIYDLINEASYYFLSRPRRFGKSLLLDTIAEAFYGNKELFKGLWIYGSDYAFPTHPVIRLDMGKASSDTPERLEESLMSVLSRQSKEEGFDLDDRIPSVFWGNLVEELNKNTGNGLWC